MNNYYSKLDKKVKDYFNILEPNYPTWLDDYINTKEMLAQQYISMSCGTYYSKLFGLNYYYPSLDHSIGVALIVWHFTHDKKETISGLFHDIATPTFKHCVDFLNGDYMKQTSTEELTTTIIKNSKEIMTLLKRDNITLEEVDDYHKYPIADNDSPKLSADRLEYSLSNALLTYNLLSFNDIKDIYNDIEIEQNEDNIKELGFKTPRLARKFVKAVTTLSIIYRDDRTRYSMQFIADIIKKLNIEGKISKEDLYTLKEQDIIKIIESSKYNDIFNIWKNTKKIRTSKNKPKDLYYVHHPSKIRYIDPLCNNIRISKTSKIVKKMIEKNLSYNMDKYVYIDNIYLEEIV